MTEGWGMVAAAAIAVIGGFVGLFVGRRQVRDQAQVEHEQWLRGQRQETFVALIAAWDEVITKVEAGVLDEHTLLYLEERDQWDEAHDSFLVDMEQAQKPLRRAAERVQMLGPETVDRAVTAMLGTVAELQLGLEEQFRSGEAAVPFAAYRAAQSLVGARRETFVASARDALRQTPDTKRP